MSYHVRERIRFFGSSQDGRETPKFNAPFKAKVALEAINRHRTINELAAKHKLHATQINLWKQQLLEGAEPFLTMTAHGCDGPDGKEHRQPHDVKLRADVVETIRHISLLSEFRGQEPTINR